EHRRTPNRAQARYDRRTNRLAPDRGGGPAGGIARAFAGRVCSGGSDGVRFPHASLAFGESALSAAGGRRSRTRQTLWSGSPAPGPLPGSATSAVRVWPCWPIGKILGCWAGSVLWATADYA